MGCSKFPQGANIAQQWPLVIKSWLLFFQCFHWFKKLFICDWSYQIIKTFRFIWGETKIFQFILCAVWLAEPRRLLRHPLTFLCCSLIVKQTISCCADIWAFPLLSYFLFCSFLWFLFSKCFFFLILSSYLNFLPSLPAVKKDPSIYGRSLFTHLFISLSSCLSYMSL